MSIRRPIGIFDSGYGGLTIFKEIYKLLPQYDYYYLGDNARVPYGIRSFETVYEFTKEGVFTLFDAGCPLVILACNTATAKAARNIQQKDLQEGRKVLGVIRPTTESADHYTTTKKIGILATQGTVLSESYKIEINRFHPHIEVFQQACPMWVPLVENNEIENSGADYFVEKSIQELLAQSPDIDTVFLACTHYPLLLPVIKKYMPEHIRVVPQGELVADRLADYLQRHPEVESRCSKNGSLTFATTDNVDSFDEKAKIFFGREINSIQVRLSKNW